MKTTYKLHESIKSVSYKCLCYKPQNKLFIQEGPE